MKGWGGFRSHLKNRYEGQFSLGLGVAMCSCRGESSANCASLELMVLCLHINYGISFLKSKPALFRKKRVSSSSPPPQHIWFGVGGGWLWIFLVLDWMF